MLAARHRTDLPANNDLCIGLKSSVSYPVAQRWSSDSSSVVMQHVTSHRHLIVRASARNSKASATEVGTASSGIL